jgi:hypothetical protein
LNYSFYFIQWYYHHQLSLQYNIAQHNTIPSALFRVRSTSSIDLLKATWIYIYTNNNNRHTQKIHSVLKSPSSQRLKWAFPSTWHLSSYSFSHLDLLKNHWAKLNQTRLWYSLDVVLFQKDFQDGHQGHCLVEKNSLLEPLDGMKPNWVQINAQVNNYWLP